MIDSIYYGQFRQFILPIGLFTANQIGLELCRYMYNVIQGILHNITPVCKFHHTNFKLSYTRGIDTPHVCTKPVLLSLKSIEDLDDGVHVHSVLRLACVVVGRQPKGGTCVNGFGMGIQ